MYADSIETISVQLDRFSRKVPQGSGILCLGHGKNDLVDMVKLIVILESQSCSNVLFLTSDTSAGGRRVKER